MHRTRLARLLTLLVALLQIGAPPLASIADARLERESERSPRAAAHVESHSSPQCPRVHPADCGLCQFLTALATPGRAAASVPASAAALAVCPEARLGARTGSRFALALPRAPPAS
ncbi:MAG: hypothetical protein ACJ79S_06130 [Gemmatimonadaceae bacterium]